MQSSTPDCPPDSAIETLIVPGTRDLGDGFEVRRALPSVQRRMIGPFVFFDQMGPARMDAGTGLDVRPHPHIGLAAVTYLFEGEILHRDSVGAVQPIRPGAVNWMTAGSGIVHSERTPAEVRATGGPVFGIQIWLALPRQHEEAPPSFKHHAASELPVIDDKGAVVRLIAGSLFGKRSPVQTLSELFYADATLAPGASLAVPAEHFARALYLVAGSLEIEGRSFDAGQLLVLRPGEPVIVRSTGAARVMLLGGEPMDGPRHIWWNFVSSSKERIEQAKEDWKHGRFAPVPDDAEFIPLPERGPAPVLYP